MGAYLKALLELRTGNNKTALESVYRALEIAPSTFPARCWEASPNWRSVTLNRRRNSTSRARTLSAQHYAGKMLAASLIKKRQYSQAIATLEPVLEQVPERPIRHSWRWPAKRTCRTSSMRRQPSISNGQPRSTHRMRRPGSPLE